MRSTLSASPSRTVIWILAIGLMTAATGLMSGLGVSVAFAQDADVVDDEADFAEPADAPRPAVTDPPAPPPRKKSYLAWAFESLGVFYSVVFLALSFTLVALFVMNLLTARRENIVPSDLIEGFESHLNAKQYQEAYELAKNDESFL